jgi:Rhodanese-like domain
MFRVAGGFSRHRTVCVTKGAPPVTPKAVAIFSIPMATYRELLQQVREQIDEIGVTEAAGLLENADAPLVVDVRERHEWDEGRLPNAVHIPRGSL